MCPLCVVEERALKSTAIATNELIPPVQYHLRRVGAFRGQAGCVDTLSFREDRQRIRISPSQIVPIGDMLTDADDELPGVCLLQIDLTQQCIGGGGEQHPTPNANI